MMSATERLVANAPGRMESHSLHRQAAWMDDESFRLHLQFVRAHGLAKGEITTLHAGGTLQWSSERRE